MKHSTSAGGVILNQKGQILLIMEGNDFWGLPKGRVKKNETLLKTAIREIEEESGLRKLSELGSLGNYQRHPYSLGTEDKTERKTIHLFLFKTNESLPLQNRENNKTSWFPLHEVVNKLTHPKDKQFIINNFSKIQNK